MGEQGRIQTPNQILQQIIIPFFLVLILIFLGGYLLVLQFNGGKLELDVLADISLLLLFSPIFIFLILVLLIFIILNYLIFYISKHLIRKFAALGNKIIHYDHLIMESSNRFLFIITKMESFRSLFNIFKSK